LFLGISPTAILAQTGGTTVSETERLAAESGSIAQTPETVIQNWPEVSRKIARTMIEKYGQPKSFSENSLVWRNNGTWKRSVAYRTAWPHFLGTRDKDFLEQTINYSVPDDKVTALKRFDKRIRVDKSNGEISAQFESEKMNYLALNLSEEIVTGKRSVEDARDFYRKTEELSRSGKASSYLDGFVFALDHSTTTTSDYLSPGME
jgi:hypothetical protein